MFITREYIRQHPDTIFVFGDNLEGKGFGGQAKECRGEINAFGVPTKRFPSMIKEAFFSDDDYEVHCWQISDAVERILMSRKGRKFVVLPGIGTGLAEMPKRCPKVFAYLQAVLQEMVKELEE
jgi:hypothetical protein